MKSLTQFIKEAQQNPLAGKEFFGEYYWKLGYKYFNKDTEKPTIEDIENCYGTTSTITGDPSWVTVDSVLFKKLKDNKWQVDSNLEHALGGSITDKEVLSRIDNCKENWYAMLRFTDKKK